MFLQLNGVRLTNNGLVDIDDIPDGATVGFHTAVANALMCVTGLVECCNPPKLGEWYFPDGSLVAFGTGGTMFRRNRGQSVIRLWRRGNPMERGRFRCELPNNGGVNQINYVNICEFESLIHITCNLS